MGNLKNGGDDVFGFGVETLTFQHVIRLSAIGASRFPVLDQIFELFEKSDVYFNDWRAI